MELPLGIGDPVAAGLVLERRWHQQHLVRCDEAAKVDGNNPELSFLLERSCVGMTHSLTESCYSYLGALVEF
jgi:hypothetical protein